MNNWRSCIMISFSLHCRQTQCFDRSVFPTHKYQNSYWLTPLSSYICCKSHTLKRQQKIILVFMKKVFNSTFYPHFAIILVVKVRNTDIRCNFLTSYNRLYQIVKLSQQMRRPSVSHLFRARENCHLTFGHRNQGSCYTNAID